MHHFITLKQKLSGDGTNISKRLHVVNLHSLLEDQSAYSSEGNHTLAIEELTVEEHPFHMNYYLGGDWKFLALVRRIDSASIT